MLTDIFSFYVVQGQSVQCLKGWAQKIQKENVREDLEKVKRGIK